jgi:hypothetical protein
MKEEEEEEEEDLFTLCRLLSRRERERETIHEQNRERSKVLREGERPLCASLGARSCVVRARAYPARIRGREKLFERQEEGRRRRANFHQRAFYITHARVRFKKKTWPVN